METMEKYKEKLKLQNVLFTLGNSALLLALLLTDDLKPANADPRWADFWQGFMCGASIALSAFMLVGLVRNIRALRDEKALKKHMAKNNDERCAQIVTHARSAGMQAFLLLGLVATVVAGYFSVAVSLTIMACVVFASVLSLIFKLYYNHKF